MGEYIKINGETCKLGTCENLYYCSYDALNTVMDLEKDEDGGIEPGEYLKSDSGFRFRFPFPDEDEIEIGTHSNYDRGLLFEVDRNLLPEDFTTGWEQVEFAFTSPTQPHIKHYYKLRNPNNTASVIKFELIQQKKCGGLLLCVFRCPYSGHRFRVESKEQIVQIVEAISSTPGYKNDFCKEVCRRIYEGYRIGTIPLSAVIL